MFKWTIVQEANRKKKDKDTEIDEDQIAKRDNTQEETEDGLEPDDYSEEEVDLDEEELDAQDYTEDDTEVEEDNVEETEEDTEPTDDVTTEDEEATDYTEEDGMDSEYSSPTDTPAPSSLGNPNDIRNASLINDYILLYDTIKGIIAKVNSMNKTDILRNKIIIQVSKNLNILLNTLHKYIIKSFDKNSYVFNLYQFNLFIHAVNVNIEMIKKNNELVSKG